jgi:three-Cys-motif partner protein
MVRQSKRAELLIRAEPDGLPTTPIGNWALDKYKLASLYSRLFSTGMKNMWSTRVYSDLYAGSGFSQIRGAEQIYYGSPLLALGVEDPFNTYIFCERDGDSLNALRQRTKRLFPNADVHFVAGDCNQKINEVMERIPKGDSVLSFCFADPFDLSIKFSTVRRMASRRTDFLLILALNMDGSRAAVYYARPSNQKIDEFLGLPDWRAKWSLAEATKLPFPRFLADLFSKQMEGIGYLPVPFYQMKQIRTDFNQPLYHLALFSKHRRAYDFWGEVLKYATDQGELGFG